MRNELVEVMERQIGEEMVPTVDARELHAFLGVGKRFATWITDRIRQGGFTEGQDFVCIKDVMDASPYRIGSGELHE